MTTSRDQASERGQGPASALGNSGRAQSQSKRELPSLEEIARVIYGHLHHLMRVNGTSAQNAYEGLASSIQALFSTVGSDSRVRELETALAKINAIRNSIIGFQKINWSEHIYPLVAALEEAGIEGLEYAEARANVGTLLEQINGAETRVRELEEALREIIAAHPLARDVPINRAAALLSQPSPTDGGRGP